MEPDKDFVLQRFPDRAPPDAKRFPGIGVPHCLVDAAIRAQFITGRTRVTGEVPCESTFRRSGRSAIPFLRRLIRRFWSMFGVPNMYTPRRSY